MKWYHRCMVKLMTKRDPAMKKLEKFSKEMKNKGPEDKKMDVDELKRLLDGVMKDTRHRMATLHCREVRPKEYIIKKGAPPYPDPVRQYKYVDDYYTTLWDFNSAVCRCCDTRKPVKEFKVRRYDRKRGLVKITTNCKECITKYKEYKKDLTSLERWALRIERSLHIDNKKDKEIRQHNLKLKAMTLAELKELK